MSTPERELLSAADVVQIGTEVGLSPEAVTQALQLEPGGSAGRLSWGGVLLGPTVSVLQRAALKAPARLEADLSYYLESRGLQQTARGIWRQVSGWWPDIYRHRVRLPLEVTTRSQRVWIRADLNALRRVHLVLALFAIAVLPLMFLFAGGLSGFLLGIAWGVAGAVAALLGYRHRVAGIERRLDILLATVTDPGYRLRPW